MKEKDVKEEPAEEDVKTSPTEVVKKLLFKNFKESVGKKVFMIKYNGDGEKVIYNDALSELKGKNYLSFTLNFSGIQIFLTDIGRNMVDAHEDWE